MTAIDDPTPTEQPVALGMTRRRFLAASAGTGLAVAFSLSAPAGAMSAEVETRLRSVGDGPAAAAGIAPAAVAQTGWVRISTDGIVTILFGGAEMGQGALTGLAQAVAEELKVDWSMVRTEAAPASMSYLTGGSSAIRQNFRPMLIAGATAREMLIAAAAAQWGVPTTSCTAVDGTVVDTTTNAVLTYGELTEAAATMPVPANPPLTPPSEYRLVGQAMPRLDIPAKTTGQAVYGIDVMVPGMEFATIVNSPTLGGTLVGTPAVPSGATAVVPLGDAVAVVASNTWAALQAAKSLRATWAAPADAASKTTSAIAKTAKTLMSTGTALTAERRGRLTSGIVGDPKSIDVTYWLPYLAHAYLEPLNCTASVTPTSCEVWAPTQAPAWVVQTAQAITGLPASQITVHVTLLGGGLGRKIEQDYVAHAIATSKARNKPVKVTWSREQDMTHDKYRPMSMSRVQATVDASTGAVTKWANRIVSPSIVAPRGWLPPGAVDQQVVDGAIGLPYAFGYRQTEWVPHPATIPLGFWRSVGHSLNAFVVESAVDELAVAAGVDPLQFRRQLLANDARSLNVLDAAAALGGWGTSLPAGRARGIAFCASFGSVVAEVVEISQTSSTSLKVHKVSVAIDCGTAVNPNQVVAQMEGGVIHALNAALWGQITFSNGVAQQRNFNTYRMMRIGESPQIAVQVIQSGAAMGGVGEPGVPPLAPALANAYYALKKKRIRTLPMFPGARMGDI